MSAPRVAYLLLMLLAPALAGAGEREFFSRTTQMALPGPIRSFVNRYLSARIDEAAPDKSARRMDFDEVEVSFPLTDATCRTLADADGLAMSLHDGRRYSIVWTDDSIAVGTMSFPASYQLIFGISQVESFNALAAHLREKRHEAGASPRRVATRVDEHSMICRRGEDFYLGALSGDTYIDAVSALPVWCADFAAESLANLFLLDNMPETAVKLTMVDYAMDSLRVDTSTSSLRYLLAGAEGGTPYFGVSGSDSGSGEIHATVVYHNPLYAYVHLLEITARPDNLFDPKAPRLRAVIHPYVKLHNLTSLWGEKLLPNVQ